MRTSFPALFVTVLIAIGIVACKPKAADEGAQEETATQTAAPAAAAERVSYQLVITNPMPHAMNVTATMPDGSQVQLGTVPASGESSFSVLGVPGESVSIVAADVANTHSPSGAVTLSAGETTVHWTIQ